MYPSGVDTHKGTIYIADTGNDQVAAYRADGTRRWRVGTRGPKQPGSFNNPRDVAYHNGRLYVADTGYNRVQVLNAKTGAWIATWPHRFQSVIGIGAGPDGHGGTVILTADDDANTVAEWTTSGELVSQIAAPVGKGNGQLDEPRDADTDSHGNIYVADFANNRMAKFGPGGKWLRNWGTKGAANGQFARPYGVAVDATDHVYVADSNNERIQEFTRKGRYVAKWGSSGDGPRPVHAAPAGCGGRRQRSQGLRRRPVGQPRQQLQAQRRGRAPVGQEPPGGGRLQRALRAGRRHADVRGRHRQPAHGAVHHGHRRVQRRRGARAAGRSPI